MVHEPDMALFISASGSLACERILGESPSKSTKLLQNKAY